MVRDSSIIAYHSITNTGILGSQQTQILSLLGDNRHDPTSTSKLWNFTRKEIAKILDLEINAVSGRVNELIKKNLVTEDPVRLCSITRRKVTPVRLHKKSPTPDPFNHLEEYFDSLREKKQGKNETT